MGELGSIKANVSNHLGQTASNCLAIVKQATSLDRSDQIFSTTPEAQLRGRSRKILGNLVGTILGTIGFACGIYSCFTGIGFFNCLATGVSAITAILELKELILQSVARAREKKMFGIVKETDESTYGLRDLMYDGKNTFIFICQGMRSLLSAQSSENKVIELEPLPLHLEE